MIVILGFFVTAADIGVFMSAKRVSSLVVFGLSAVGVWAAPMIAEYYSTKQTDKLARLARLAVWFTSAFTIPVSLAFLVFGEELLGVFGPEFRAGHEALMIMVAGQMVNAFTGPIGYLLTMTGHQNKVARVEAASAILAVTLCFILIPRVGIVGAAWADAVANVFRNITLFFVVWRTIGIRSTIV